MADVANGSDRIDPLGDRLIRLFWRKPPATLAERTRRRVSVHLIPYLFFLYILAYLDRVNVSIAQLDMEKPIEDGGLGFDSGIIGFGAGLFFWGYWILEIPSTLSVAKWGARWVFVRILVLWGICATLVGFIGLPVATRMFEWLPTLPEDVNGLRSIAHFVNNLPQNAEYQFYFFRFMLGFFEGGFFPSVIVYLSYWFRQEDRAKSIASFMAAIPISIVIGVPSSRLLLEVNWFGLEGWRWVFLTEGILPILAGFTTIFFLPDSPSKARWLNEDERGWLSSQLEGEHRLKKAHGIGAWKGQLGMVLLLTLVYFCQNVSSYGLSMFMPAIMKEAAQSAGKNIPTILTTATYFLALLGMLINGWHSDKKNERPWHVAVPMFVLGISILAAGLAAKFTDSTILPVVIMVVFVGLTHYAQLPAFWPIPTMFLGAAAAASAIGFINMIGNLGGFFGPWMVGEAGKVSFADGLLKLAPWSMAAAAIVLGVTYFRRRMGASVPNVSTPTTLERADDSSLVSSVPADDDHERRIDTNPYTPSQKDTGE